MSDYKRTVSDNENGDDASREQPDVSHVSNPNVAHEVNDVNVFAIVKFVVGLSVATAVVFALMAGMMAVLERLEARNDTTSPLARQGDERLPQSQIKLQGGEGHKFAPESLTFDADYARQMNSDMYDFQLDDPTTEWRAIKEIRRIEMNSYGRLQNNPNEFHIPIEDAKKLLLERNQLPARQTGEAISQALTTPLTEATSAQLTLLNRQATGGGAQQMPTNNQVNPLLPLSSSQQASVPRVTPEGFEVIPTGQSSGKFLEKRPARPTIGQGQHASGQTTTPHGSQNTQYTGGKQLGSESNHRGGH